MREKRAAGGVVYRERGGKIEVVLGEQDDRLTRERTTRLPKGKLDAGEAAEQAAVREVAEETGFAVELEELLVQTRHVYDEGKGPVEKRVDFFLMRHTGDAGDPDGEFVRVFWCELASAAERLTYPNEAEAVRRARARIAERAARAGSDEEDRP